MEQVTIWQVLVALLIPTIVGGFGLVWARINAVERHNEEKRAELWKAFDEERKSAHAFQLRAAEDFARRDALTGLKEDFDKRLDRIEGKLDQALAQRHGSGD